MHQVKYLRIKNLCGFKETVLGAQNIINNFPDIITFRGLPFVQGLGKHAHSYVAARDEKGNILEHKVLSPLAFLTYEEVNKFMEEVPEDSATLIKAKQQLEAEIRRRRPGEIRRLTAEMVTTFQNMGVTREEAHALLDKAWGGVKPQVDLFNKLHADVMNIPSDPGHGILSMTPFSAYNTGHRAARHAAAALVTEATANLLGKREKAPPARHSAT